MDSICPQHVPIYEQFFVGIYFLPFACQSDLYNLSELKLNEHLVNRSSLTTLPVGPQAMDI